MSEQQANAKVDQAGGSVTFTLDNGDEITITHFGDVLKVEAAGGLVICTEGNESVAVSTYEALLT